MATLPAPSKGPLVNTRALCWPRYGMLAAWLIASAEPLRWMFLALAQPAHVVQRLVLMALVLLGLIDVVRKAASPQTHPRALAIVLVGVVLTAVARIGTDVHFMHATAALLLLYAISATYLDATTWRQRLVLLLVTLLCLPIQPHIDAHLGLPLRLWTAHAVAPLLQALGVGNVTVESIIVTENGVADVASACSGVRTLWYAMALWLGARLAWPQATARRWWLAGALSATIAVGFNALRVTALVVAMHHNAPPLLVDMAHASLGLLALALVGAANFWLCRGPVTVAHPAGQTRQLRWQTHTLLVGLVTSVALLPTPTRPMQDPANLQALTWPARLQTESVALSGAEQNLVLGYGATIAEKQRFNLQGTRGSLLVVQSKHWRAHHAPELCLLAQGARIEQQARISTRHGSYRVVTLQAGAQTAVTWFQSGTQVVPDLGARLWSQLLHPQQHWSLVTLVVDTPASDTAVQDLHQAVHAVVASSHKQIESSQDAQP
ncbi:MAG: archaeosortase/exosortase family protein [Pseudomonadota bacterium]